MPNKMHNEWAGSSVNCNLVFHDVLCCGIVTLFEFPPLPMTNIAVDNSEKIFLMSAFIESVIAGVIGNLVFTGILIWVIQEFRYWLYLKRKFHKRDFKVFWKAYPNDVVQKIRCTVSGHTIKFTGRNVKEKNSLVGEFVMNPINLKMGEGYHTHTDDLDAFGFSRIIIKDNVFYVEMPYTGVNVNKSQNKEGNRVYQAFV